MNDVSYNVKQTLETATWFKLPLVKWNLTTQGFGERDFIGKLETVRQTTDMIKVALDGQ